MRQTAAAVLQYVHRWLEGALGSAPPFAGAVPPLVAAAGLYQAGQYRACANVVLDVIGALQRARWAYPNLPPL
jgi:hypothetical protein